MEVERKFLMDKDINIDLSKYQFYRISQYYLSKEPEIRIREKYNSLNKNEAFYLTIKSDGTISREETEIELNRTQFDNLRDCALAKPIKKKRYIIPIADVQSELHYQEYFKSLIIELDVFEENLAGLVLAEIEFVSEDKANLFVPPTWFGMEVTYDKKYKNKNLAFNGL